MKKKNIKIITAVAVAAIMLVGFALLWNTLKPKTYSTAKIECEKILKKNQVQMEELAINALQSGENASGEFEDYFYNCYQSEGYVKFEIDAQGMLGGQYWDLVYTIDGMLYGETEKYLYEENDGNNVIRAERIDAHWWYLWTDYDGTDKSYQ